jgi:hypothetical protein
MARNGSGTYAKVNTFVAGNSVTAAGHNQNWDDLATEMTNSVAADGQTSMTGPLKAANGSAAAPAVTFASDTDTGPYRIGANNYGISIGGTKIFDLASTGLTITGTITGSGIISTTDATDSSSTSTGSGIFAGGLGVAKNLYVGTDVLAGNGTVSLPAFSFISDPDTGAYRIGANNYGIAVNGVKELDVATTGLTITHALTVGSGFTVSAGSVSLPAGSIANAALAAPGGVVKISTQSLSGAATADVTSGLDDTYDHYEWRFNGTVATDDVALYLRVSTDSGSTFVASGTPYHFGGVTSNDGGTNSVINSTGANQIQMTSQAGAGNGIGNASTKSFHGYIRFSNPESTALHLLFEFRIVYVSSGGTLFTVSGVGQYAAAGNAINALRILTSSGNLSGRFSLYGYTKA